MNDTYVTVAGNLVAEPEPRTTKQGVPYAALRVACTTRRRRPDGAYENGPTSFYNVTAFRSLGLNVQQSLRKGDPVVVHGRLSVRSWQRNDESWATSVDIDASQIGHDLARGVSQFHKVFRSADSMQSSPSVLPRPLLGEATVSSDESAGATAGRREMPPGYIPINPETGEVLAEDAA